MASYKPEETAERVKSDPIWGIEIRKERSGLRGLFFYYKPYSPPRLAKLFLGYFDKKLKFNYN